MVIPKSLMPTGAKRSFIEQRIGYLDALIDPDLATQRQDEHDRQRQIAELLLVYASQLGEVEATAHSHAYATALDDVPCWALREAVRGWLKGEIGGREARRGFPPPAPILRDYALSLVAQAKGQRVMLRRLLGAEEEPPPLTDEQRARAQAHVANLLRPAPDAEGEADG